MDPRSTPWRVLDAPPATGTGPPPGPPDPVSSPGGATLGALSPGTLKAITAAIGAVGCAALAFAIAFTGGGGETVLVSGGSALAGIGDDSSPGINDPTTVDDEVVVEIVGAVLRPGVFRLAAGSRVGDLVMAAGGYGPRVDTAAAEQSLNLAAPLQDGDRVRVPSRDDPVSTDGPGATGGGGPASQGSGAGPVDVNVASAEELDALPGVGPATIEKIVAAREEAAFTSVDDLRTRGIVGEKTLEKLRPLVTVR